MRKRKILIPSAQDLETLRKSIEDAVNSVQSSVSFSKFGSDIDANNFRIFNLGSPASKRDAVNVSFLERALDTLEARMERKTLRPNLQLAYGFNDAEFEITAGGFVIKGVDMKKAFNFDTDIFGNTVDFTILNEAIGTPHLKAGSVTTPKLTTQEIDIGYGGNGMPVRLRIRDTQNNPIGWIGDDSAEHGGNTNYVGAWFKRALFGGDGTIGNAKAFIDANGNMALKSVFVYDTDGTVGWIGSSGSYQGGWFKQLYVGGTGPANAPLYADSNGTVVLKEVKVYNASGTVGWIGSSGSYQGGWFKELYVGGTGPSAPSFYSDSSGNVFIANNGIRMSGSDYVLKMLPSHGLTVEATSGIYQYGAVDINAGMLTLYDTRDTNKRGNVKIWNYGMSVIDYRADGSGLGGVNVGAFLTGGSGEVYIREGPSGNLSIRLDGYRKSVELAQSSEYTPSNVDMGVIINKNDGLYWRMPGGSWYKMAAFNTDVTFNKVTSSLGYFGGKFEGAGVACPNDGVGAKGFNVFQSGSWYYGVEGPVSFTTSDGKTVTVRGGVIVSIV